MATLYGTFNQPGMASSEFGSGQLPMWSPSQEILAMSPGAGWEPMLDPNTGQFIGFFQTPDSRDATSQRGMVYNPETGTLGEAQDYAYDYVGGGGLNHPSGFGFMSKAVPLFIGSVLGGLGATQLGLIGSGAPAASGMGSFPAGVGELASFGPEFTGLGGTGFAATPQITDAMLAGANATSDPIAYLNAQAGWTASDPAYLASLTTVPPGTTTPGYAAPPEWPTTPPAGAPTGTPTGTGNVPTGTPTGSPTGSNTGFQIPTDAAGWLKLLAPVIGGGLAAWDAKNASGENPQDPFTRDYLRGLLTGPQSSNQSSGLLGTIGQLQGKKYY